jgi:hypothetical protein
MSVTKTEAFRGVGVEAHAKALHGPSVPTATTLVSGVSLPGGVVVKVFPFELWSLTCSLAQLASSLGVGGLLLGGPVRFFSLVQFLGAAARCAKFPAELPVFC